MQDTPVGPRDATENKTDKDNPALTELPFQWWGQKNKNDNYGKLITW